MEILKGILRCGCFANLAIISSHFDSLSTLDLFCFGSAMAFCAYVGWLKTD